MTPIEQMVDYLREEYLLKRSCDYCYLHSCVTGRFTFLLSSVVWFDYVTHAANRFDVPLETVLVTERRCWK